MATEEQPPIELDNAGLPVQRWASVEQPEPWHNEDNEIEQSPLPPTDRGTSAWLVLAASSLIQLPVWGFSLAFGVLQEYYSSHPEELGGDVEKVVVIGTTVTGIMYLISPFTFALLTRWPRARRWCGPIGLVLAAAGFLLSSFGTKVWHLIATQGVLSALGCGLLFTPTTLYLDEWFVRKKGLAYGVMWAGKSLTGVGLPFAMEASLRRFGPATTLRAWSILTVLTSAPLLPLLRPRIPLPPTSTPRPISTAFLTLPTFWLLQGANILQSLGYSLPSAYISSYTVQHLHLSPTIGTLVLALINTTSIPGGIFIGGLGDHVDISTTMLISTLGSAAAVFLFWGLSSQVALLVLFAVSYGFFAGGFSSTWSGMMVAMKREEGSLDTGFLFGLLAGGRGVGNVVSGPLSVALLTREGWLKDGRSWGYSGQYGGIILFTGATALTGGWGALGRWCR